MPNAITRRTFSVKDYDLDSTLTSGQAFRWQKHGNAWTGVVGNRWVRLRSESQTMLAETTGSPDDWSWLVEYLQLEVDLSALLASFPDDEPMRKAIIACRGLRLLRQDPWECLASFILSSTKQIVQIQQIIGHLCERFGEPVQTPAGYSVERAFPTPDRLVKLTESQLRECKMGFRAPYLLGSAQAIVSGEVCLASLRNLPLDEARTELLRLPGVGRKIADCVLLFAYGVHSAFPIDVWVTKALRQLYFPRRRPNLKRLHLFAANHFGEHAGYAQQYLFHYMRTRKVVVNQPKPMGVALRRRAIAVHNGVLRAN
jgi:N-glycosylase/DNA lyase